MVVAFASAVTTEEWGIKAGQKPMKGTSSVGEASWARVIPIILVSMSAGSIFSYNSAYE